MSRMRLTCGQGNWGERMIELMDGAEDRLKLFKVPKVVTTGVPIICPNCQEQRLYSYLSTIIYSGAAKVGDFCCTGCQIVVSPKDKGVKK